MSFDRRLWTCSLDASLSPGWICPTCHRGQLRFVKDSVVSKETIKSKRDRSEDTWDPDSIVEQFVGWLKCNQAGCSEDVAILGWAGHEPQYDGEDYTWVRILLPLVVRPMPDIFELPKKCPDGVKEEIRGAFALFWLDASASANRLRVGLEKLLDHVGIKRRRRAPGKIVDLTLHQRIELYQKSEPVLGSYLMAVKWLGNTASHDSIRRETLLDAFEVFDHAITEVLDERSKKVANLAKKLTTEHKNHRRKRG